MENNVTTLETSRKLQAAGFPQDTSGNWFKDTYPSQALESFLTWGSTETESIKIECAAPTAQEIADQLPPEHGVAIYLSGDTIRGPREGVHAMLVGDELSMVQYHTMAEALAALWLKLQEAK